MLKKTQKLYTSKTTHSGASFRGWGDSGIRSSLVLLSRSTDRHKTTIYELCFVLLSRYLPTKLCWFFKFLRTHVKNMFIALSRVGKSAVLKMK